jgi:uncharacterized protein with von Willebrand factor type A (vWA) domain
MIVFQSLVSTKKITKKMKREKKKSLSKKKKNIKDLNFYFLDTYIPQIPESTKRIIQEIHEEYPIKVEKIRNSYEDIKDLSLDKKTMVLEMIAKLEELFFTALFEDLNIYLAIDLAYTICMESEINTKDIFPFNLYKNK